MQILMKNNITAIELMLQKHALAPKSRLLFVVALKCIARPFYMELLASSSCNAGRRRRGLSSSAALLLVLLFDNYSINVNVRKCSERRHTSVITTILLQFIQRLQNARAMVIEDEFA